MPNSLEQLVAEWYEFKGYFILRNVHVGRASFGGYKGELDIAAFNPVIRRLIAITPKSERGVFEAL
jgi:hypothetical protein